jgi:hypothetical protein
VQYNTIQYNTIQYNSIQCVHVRSSVHPSVYNTKEYNTIQCVHVRSSDRPSVRSYLNSVKPCHGTFLWTFAGTSIITIIQSSINKEYNTIQYNASMSVHPFVRPCDRIKLPLSPVTVPFFALYIHELSCVALNSSLRLCPAGTTCRKRARQTPLNSGSITASPS